MKKYSKILLSALVTAPLIFNTLPIAAASEEDGSSFVKLTKDTSVSLTGEKITLEYVSTVYNGKEQKPSIKVRSGNSTLAENTDFTVTYPKDCTSAGKKTVVIKGIGNYTGTFSATYMIEPLDCSEKNANVQIEIANECVYTGMPLMPDVTVTANGLTLGGGDFTLEYSNNVDITAAEDKKAKCTVTFRGNFSGSRTVDFNIVKAPSEDFDIEIKVHPGDCVSYDLSPLKPAGAVFGAITYYLWDYVPEHQPKIAFNDLTFTVPDGLTGGTAIVIPVTNSPTREDYNIIVYPTATDKIIPTLIIRSADREYNGEPISADTFASNGSYAVANGIPVEGTWEIRTDPPLLPCGKQPCVVIFTPNDPRYESVETVVFITISRAKAAEFTLKPHRTELALGQTGQLVISGIPEDYKGSVTLTCSSDELGVTEVFCKEVTQREYEIDFPVRSGKYTFKAELSGDGLHMPAVSQCSITVGDYVPPEDKPADKTTTAEELTALINSALEGGTVKAEGIRTIPADLVKAASDKRLILEVKLNENYTWIVDTAQLSNRGELDLDISTAVIPAVLLDKVGEENLCSFNVFAKNLGTGTKLRVSAEYKKNLFANLFFYSTTGDLKFVSCAPVKSDGTAQLDITASGKYAVMTDTETKLAGDLNNNCATDLSDIAALLKQYVTLPPETKPEGKYLKYDVNGDGSFTITDITDLLKIYVNS